MKFFIVLALAAVAAATPVAQRQSYSAPAPAPAAPAAPVFPDVPPVYTYNYAINDEESKANFEQTENRDGAITTGSYTVALPDGRIQTVTYRVEGDGGYVAEVTYEGEAQYPPEPAPKPAASYPAPQPKYNFF